MIHTRYPWLFSSKLLVFNPYTHLEKQIGVTAQAITDHFNSIDSAIDKGVSLKDAVGGTRIQSVMQRVISSAHLAGFTLASQTSGRRMPVGYGRAIGAKAASRAQRVNTFMRVSTKRTIRKSPDGDYVLSRDRAYRAARFEAAKAFYAGIRDGFQGTGYQKNWVTSSDNPCIECQDNEDEGPVSMDSEFQSGDLYPAAHLQCSCFVVVEK